MRFAHIADVHIGSWRDAKLRDVSTDAFLKAMDRCIEKKMDFILISGDLFNTALPDIDSLKKVAEKLRLVKESDIPVYMIAGSHDFSASGKTMLHVLEKAGLVIDVHKGEIVGDRLQLKFTADRKTGAKITGILGKKGMLDRHIYEDLDRKHIEENIRNEKGFKIFMFHTALTEFRPKDMENMESSSLELLPKNFDYYAGGHVHYIFEKDVEGYGKIAYPGALFPANFKELEEYQNGGFYIYEEGILRYEPIEFFPVIAFEFDCSLKTPLQVEEEVKRKIRDLHLKDAVVLMRFHGKLGNGKVSEIGFGHLFEAIENKGAYFIMKNTNSLSSPELEEMEQLRLKDIDKSPEQVETEVIKEHLGKFKIAEIKPENEEKLTSELIRVLLSEKEEGENVSDFERRIRENVDKVLEVERVV